MNLHAYDVLMECYKCKRYYGVQRPIDVEKTYVYIGCSKCRESVWFRIEYIGTSPMTHYHPNTLTVTVNKRY